MDRLHTCRISITTALCIMLAGLASPCRGAREPVDPHWMGKHCTECHVADSLPELRYDGDVVRLCNRCHGTRPPACTQVPAHGGRLPDPMQDTMPAAWPLDDGRITCRKMTASSVAWIILTACCCARRKTNHSSRLTAYRRSLPERRTWSVISVILSISKSTCCASARSQQVPHRSSLSFMTVCMTDCRQLRRRPGFSNTSSPVNVTATGMAMRVWKNRMNRCVIDEQLRRM